jgi:hypothetical protein
VRFPLRVARGRHHVQLTIIPSGRIKPRASSVADAQVEVWALEGGYTKRFVSRTMPDAPA